MTRKESLINLICKDEQSKDKYLSLIEEVIFLESQLDKLKKLPFIKVHPKNPEMQKATPAAKQYKELLQQYTNCLKVLFSASGNDSGGEESPLRKWMKKYVDSE